MADGANTAEKRAQPRRARTPASHDPIEIAMEAMADEAGEDNPARRLLIKQERLVGWQIAGERMGFALRAGLGLLGVVAVGLLAVMVWRAAHADGLVIRPFSVPPVLVQRGVTGEALAAQLMDRMAVMSRIAPAAETQREIAAAQNEVSIQIPETGISISQLEQWLTEKLGHQRRVTGELMAAPDGGLVLAARVGSEPLVQQRGPEQDLGALVQRAAEELYSREQPFSYGVFLSRSNRLDDLRAFRLAQIASPDRATKAFGYAGLAGRNINTDFMDAKRLLEKAVSIDAKSAPSGYNNLGGIEARLGHWEAGRRDILQDARLLKDRTAFTMLSKEARAQWIHNDEMELAREVQDLTRALRLAQAAAQEDLRGFQMGATPDLTVATMFLGLHDIGPARAILADFRQQNDQQQIAVTSGARAIAAATEDWPRAWTAWQSQTADWPNRTDKGVPAYEARSLGADILVHLGRLDEAQAMLDQTPADCVPCLTVRGELAAARGDKVSADRWLGEASRLAPSFPMPAWRWGQVLLARRDYPAAIAQFQIANKRGPGWAEPLVGWGEALAAQGQAKAAATKLEAAARLAPNWGRLHLKWGQALAASGEPEKARAQLKTAQGLFLTASEHAELDAALRGIR